MDDIDFNMDAMQDPQYLRKMAEIERDKAEPALENQQEDMVAVLRRNRINAKALTLFREWLDKAVAGLVNVNWSAAAALADRVAFGDAPDREDSECHRAKQDILKILEYRYEGFSDEDKVGLYKMFENMIQYIPRIKRHGRIIDDKEKVILSDSVKAKWGLFVKTNKWD